MWVNKVNTRTKKGFTEFRMEILKKKEICKLKRHLRLNIKEKINEKMEDKIFISNSHSIS
jgi:hypothetical protein